MMRKAQHLLLISASVNIVQGTTYEDFGLRLKPEIHQELNYLSNNEWAGKSSFDSSSCESPLVSWSKEKMNEMGYRTYKELFDNRILQMPYVYKHYIDKNENEESFGLDGSQTDELKRRHADTMAFWTAADVDDSITTDGILLLSMHGSDLMDNSKLVPVITRMFDFDNENDVLAFALEVQNKIRSLPDGPNNPLLTMNAVATNSASSGTRDSIIIGDGVLQFLSESGFLSSSGPDFVHAHEYGHHLQFEINRVIPHDEYDDEVRREELMADALSAYFLTHDLGGNMVAEEIEIFHRTAFATGDCSVTKEDHHGTPRQRQCAAIWGASIAAPDRDLIDPETFANMFNNAYFGILELGSSYCTLVLEEPDEEQEVVFEPEETFPPESPVQIETQETEPPAHYESQEAESPVHYESQGGDSPVHYETQETKSPQHEPFANQWEEEKTWEQYATEDKPPETTTDVGDSYEAPVLPSESITSPDTNNVDSTGDTYYERVPSMPTLSYESSSAVNAATEEYQEVTVKTRGDPGTKKLEPFRHDYTKNDCNLPFVYCDPETSSGHFRQVSYIYYVLPLFSPFLLNLFNLNM